MPARKLGHQHAEEKVILRLRQTSYGLLSAALLWAAGDFPHRLDHRPTPEHHQQETMPGGVATLDFDQDGWLDLFFTNAAAPSTLYRNLQGKGWQDVTASSGLRAAGYTMGAAAADYDGDGRTDLLVLGVSETSLWRNLGDGRFEDTTARAGIAKRAGWSIGAGFFDYDRDGDLDLFLVRYVAYDPAQEPFCGAADRSYRTYCHPKFYTPLSNLLYRNEGGRFRDVSREAGIAAHPGKGMSVAFGDADGDGWLDAFVANDTVRNFLFRNRRDGTFEEIGTASGVGTNDDGLELSSMGADFRDLDGDGREDIFVTALANESFPLFRNLGQSQFLDITYRAGIGGKTLPYSGWAVGAYDFDNNGERDLFIAAGDVHDNTELFSARKSKQRCLLLKRNAKSVFALEEIGEAAWHRGAAFGDFDNDGTLEAVVSRLGATPWHYRPPPNSRNWIGFRVPPGTLVRISSAGRTQWNRATSAVGYASSSDPRVHFGLGDAQVDSVEFTGPDGHKSRLEKPAVNRYHSQVF